MPRALASFKKLGLEVIPATTDLHTVYNGPSGLLAFLPEAQSLEKTTYSLTEYVGLLYYWLRGWV